MKPVTTIALLVALCAGVGLWFVTRPEGPRVEVPASWKTVTYENGLTMRYPETFGLTYVHELDWPPQAQVIEGPLSCIEAGGEMERAGRTETRTIDGRTYCVTTLVEGAAGSTYTQYAYATARGNKVMILTFSTRMPQCANYPDPERGTCEREQNGFELDALVDRIFQTI
jgi:hypothetical protein